MIGRGLAPLLTVSLVSSLIMLDSNIVAVSLLAIGRSYATSFSGLQWVISAYVLTFCALLLAAGSYADLRGRKRAMEYGLAIFAAASLGCGLAQSVLTLDMFRAVQGIGAALLLTSSLAIISHDYVGTERVRAFAIWGASIGVALAAGPIIGGVVTQLFGWRWIFLANVPICLLLLEATARYVAESRDPNAKGLDLSGVASFSLGIAILIHALITGNDLGWASFAVVAQLGAAVAILTAFVWLEERGSSAMIDLALFRCRAFVGAILTMMGYGAALQVLIFLLPLYLQIAYGLRPVNAGLAMIPFAAPMVFAPRFASRLAARISTAGLLVLGLLLGAAGEATIATVARATLAYPWFAAGMVLAGCGAGLLNGLTVKAVQSSVSEDRAGMASGMAATARFIGLLVSVAGFGAILFSRVRSAFAPAALAAGLTPETTDDALRYLVAGDMTSLLSSVPRAMGDQLLRDSLVAYSHGFSAAITAAALTAGLTAAVTWRSLRNSELRPTSVQPCMPVDCRHPV